MPTITIEIPKSDFLSLQVGDTAYYATPNDNIAGFRNADQSDIVEIGTITAVTIASPNVVLTCEIDAGTTPPTSSDFILFSKDNKVNLSSLLGYYASVKLRNNSTTKAEMYSVACEINESSK
tara:strand:- start:3194 stop:3559 length:366 start_codon:yes stop_codon:yes gene_type:complete